MEVLVTGCAGFIGFNVAKSLLERGDTIIGVDSINKYYDIQLKKDRLEQLLKNKQRDSFSFYKYDLSQKKVKAADVIKAMKLDKKTINNIIKLILVKGIGKAFICDTIDEKNLSVFLKNNGFM